MTTRRIELTNGGYTMIDAADYPLASQYRWHRNSNGYARATVWRDGQSWTVYLHRLIINAQSGTDTDHINGDRLDNTRPNLRSCSHSQNMANQHCVRGRSKYRGVTYHVKRRCWYAEIKHAGRRIFIGAYDSEVQAAQAYNVRAIELYGAFAHPNQL